MGLLFISFHMEFQCRNNNTNLKLSICSESWFDTNGLFPHAYKTQQSYTLPSLISGTLKSLIWAYSSELDFALLIIEGHALTISHLSFSIIAAQFVSKEMGS